MKTAYSQENQRELLCCYLLCVCETGLAARRGAGRLTHSGRPAWRVQGGVGYGRVGAVFGGFADFYAAAARAVQCRLLQSTSLQCIPDGPHSFLWGVLKYEYGGAAFF